MAFERAPTCPDCAVEGAPRDAWGCDAPTPAGGRPSFKVSCLACGGVAAACAECGGTGLVGMRRCPNVLMGERPATAERVMRFWRAYGPWREHGVAPRRGGSQDQAATFLRAAGIADAEIARYRREDEDRSRREVERAKARAARGVGR